MYAIQQVVYQPVTPLGALAAALLVPVIGYISGKLYDGLKTILPPFDKLPAIVHQIAAPLFGLLFGWVTAATGAALLTDIHGATAGWFGAVLNALVMAGLKRWEKAKAPADATVVLEASRKASASANLSPAKVGRTRRPALGSRPLGPEDYNTPGSVDRPTSPGT
jgi:hypothetical protein